MSLTTIRQSVVAIFSLILSYSAVSDTGDITEEFNHSLNSLNCPPGTYINDYDGDGFADEEQSFYWVDVDIDNDGTDETTVVFLTFDGESHPYYDNSNHYFFTTSLDSNCGGSYPYTNSRALVVMRFIQNLPGDPNIADINNWPYVSIPAIEFTTYNDHSHGDSTAGIPPYLQSRTFRNLNAQDVISSENVNTPNTFRQHQHSDIAGIREVVIRSDFGENTIDNIKIYSSYIDFNAPTEPPEVSILMDTSGSMNWGFDGNYSAPVQERRLTLAKNAVEPFLLMMSNHYSGIARFGFNAFPGNQRGLACTATTVTPMIDVHPLLIHDAINNDLANLNASGSTPLLAGLEHSRNTLQGQGNKAIVLLSDGYHNCPGYVSPTDSEVTQIISDLNFNNISVYSIGFGRPSDIDHPLLDTISNQTSGAFYDITGVGFNANTWNPGVALQEAYKNIAVDTLGLESIVDPLAFIKPWSQADHHVSLSPYDEKVSFFVSWENCEKSDLDIKLLDSYGEEINAKYKNVTLNRSHSYWLATVSGSTLSKRTTHKPWTIQVTSRSSCNESGTPYQYSVLGQSALQFDAVVVDQQKYLHLAAHMKLKGKTIPLVESIQVEILPPAYAETKLPEKTVTLNLYDNGKNGDKVAKDGIYSLNYDGTISKGTYTFNFTTQNSSKYRFSFERYLRVKKAVGYDLTATEWTSEK